VCSKSLDQVEWFGLVEESRQTITRASKDAEARIVPNFG
jgi:hypothetical protein